MAAHSSEIVSKGNRLQYEKSPYLLQHAHNPVDWFPWGEEAFTKAKQEDKPIFLSVGYSTCHWCHVMERESFENDNIGKLMSDHFVNIKVDREERPDVDKMYMNFVQRISGSGGWPMSVFLTPDLKPITGGTYFPPEDNFGRPGFPSILKLISKQWRDKREGVLEQSEMMINALKSAENDTLAESLPESRCMDKCYELLSKSFEDIYGGFSRAPKFPQPVNIDFLLRYHFMHKGEEKGIKALQMVEHTLKSMANGGIHDHIAQGFHRYSTDMKWHVPHFEKMLYDQAQLTVAYAEAFNITRKQIYKDVVQDIIRYVDRDLTSPSGGLYSAEDADSLEKQGDLEKKEGAFCVWKYEHVQSLLSQSIPESSVTLAQVFTTYFNVKPEGNVDPRADPHGELKGQNVLITRNRVNVIAEELGINEFQVVQAIQASNKILFNDRLKRPKPHLDDKIITAWNGLMISGYARAAGALFCDEYACKAMKVVEFIKKNLSGPQPATLLRSCYTDLHRNVTQIATPINGFADDYAYLIQGLLDLYEVVLDESLIELALQLQSTMNSMFWDEQNAAYYLSPANDQSILMRIKEDQDGAEPSCNSIACLNLVRLSQMLHKPELQTKAELILKSFAFRINKIPLILPKMLTAYMQLTTPSLNVVLCGDRDDPQLKDMIKLLNNNFLPFKSVVYISNNKESWLKRECGFYGSFATTNEVSAFVCKDKSCSLPVNTANQLMPLILQS